MKKQLSCILAAALVLSLLLAGCGAGSMEHYANEDAAKMVDMNDVEMPADAPAAERKVIVTGYYSVQTTDFSAASAALEKAVKDSGGYIASSDINGDADNGRASYQLRIPVKKMDTFTEALRQVGTVTDRTYGEEDITDQYYDLDARLKAKEAQRDRLLELIKKAETLSDLLTLEKELAEVQGELDSMSGQIKRYDNQVAYATVNVQLWQSDLTQSENTPFGPRVTRAFRDSFSTALEVCKDLVVAFIWLLPFLVVVAVIVVIILLATRKRRRARREMQKNMPAYRAPYASSAPPAAPTEEKKE